MNATKLIAELTALVLEHGDMEVNVHSSTYYHRIAGVKKDDYPHPNYPVRPAPLLIIQAEPPPKAETSSTEGALARAMRHATVEDLRKGWRE